MAGLEDCEGLLYQLSNKKVSAGKYPARHFASTLDMLLRVALSNVPWVSGPQIPADGLTKNKSNTPPKFQAPPNAWSPICPTLICAYTFPLFYKYSFISINMGWVVSRLR